MKRYAEQINYSWCYNWGIFREIWDMFTMRHWHWLVVGLLAVLCMLPSIVMMATPHSVAYYVTHSIPAFAPSLSQELAITEYLWHVPEKPSLLLVFNYFWISNGEFNYLANVLCVISGGLLLVAHFREKEPMRLLNLVYLPLALLCIVRIKLAKMRRGVE